VVVVDAYDTYRSYKQMTVPSTRPGYPISIRINTGGIQFFIESCFSFKFSLENQKCFDPTHHMGLQRPLPFV
jgi:hypothetical protein